jgi:preprotein translocase subunit YajC
MTTSSLFNVILLQASGGSGYAQILMMVGIFVVFYFFMIRPQQKKTKDQKTYLTSLKKGDTVVTIGGLHGKIVSLDDETVVLEVGRAVSMKFDRSAISMESSKRASAKTEIAEPAS